MSSISDVSFPERDVPDLLHFRVFGDDPYVDREFADWGHAHIERVALVSEKGLPHTLANVRCVVLHSYDGPHESIGDIDLCFELHDDAGDDMTWWLP